MGSGSIKIPNFKIFSTVAHKPLFTYFLRETSGMDHEWIHILEYLPYARNLEYLK